MSTTVPEDIPQEKRIEWLSKNLDKFCVLPWLNLNTNTDGNIKLCCNIQLEHLVADADTGTYNLGKHDIETIWNSVYMKYTRKMHRRNFGSTECKECYKAEKVSGHSPRVGQNALWIERQDHDEQLKNHLVDVSQEEPMVNPVQLPTSLELRLGNQCNLRCITCWGMSSSLIHEERSAYLKNNLLDDPKLIWLKSRWKNEIETVEKTEVSEWFDTDIFYNNFRKMAPTLRRLYTTGGEPTVIKANYKMLQMLLDAGNTDCRIEFTSNMTNWNPLFYSNLSKFKNVEIQMSIDGVDEIGEYIRYPSDFSKVRENIDKVVKIASRNPNWSIKCYTVLQALNYKHLTPIWDLLNNIGFKYCKSIDWWPITLVAPAFLSLGAVPLETRTEYMPELQKAFDLFKELGDGRLYLADDTISACKESMLNVSYQPILESNLATFIEFTDKQRAVTNKLGKI
jgi:organic radical activating enzyme